MAYARDATQCPFWVINGPFLRFVCFGPNSEVMAQQKRTITAEVTSFLDQPLAMLSFPRNFPELHETTAVLSITKHNLE